MAGCFGLGLCRDTSVVLSAWIAEAADEPLVLEPAMQILGQPAS